MSHISITSEPDLFIITAEGDLTFDDIKATIKKYYPRATAAHVLWDFRRASLDTITLEQIREIAALAKSAVGHRDGGKTAYVGTDETVYSLTCMYAAVATLANIPIDYSVFKSMEEARRWFSLSAETSTVQDDKRGRDLEAERHEIIEKIGHALLP